MLPKDRADQLLAMPLAHLLADLLKQFNKPTLLGQRGISLTKSDIDALAQAIASRQPLPDDAGVIITTLAEIVQESLTELQSRFGFTFAQSLAKSDMSDLGGWQTTAEFLEIANHKNNAELRISAGASLLAFLGDARYADELFTVIHYDSGLGDVEAVIARRALSFYAHVDFDAKDWEQLIRAALE